MLITKPVGLSTAPLAEGPIGVIIAAPPNMAQPFMMLGSGRPAGVSILTTTRDANDLAEDIQQFKPQMVLLSPEVRNYTPELVKQLAHWPEFPMAVIGLVPAEGTWGAEMAANGALTFYTLPVTSAIVDRLVADAPSLVSRAQAAWNKPVLDSGVDRKTMEALRATSYRTGVVGFWSTKGGVGKTSLAVSTACLLAFIAGKKTLLIDGDMNCGRVLMHLNIPSELSTLLHLAGDYQSAGNHLDGKMLKHRVVYADSYLDPRTKVVESRLDVLFGITSLEHASSDVLRGRQGEQFMTDLLQVARELYDYVIVDLGSNTQMGPHFGALKASDVIIFVNTSDRTALYPNRDTLKALVAGGFRLDKFRMVVNRYHPSDRLTLRDIADFMNMTVKVVVPEDLTREMVASVNEGQPFVLSHMKKKKNSPEIEATLTGLLKVAEEIYPPMSAFIAERSGNGHKPGFLGLGNGSRDKH